MKERKLSILLLQFYFSKVFDTILLWNYWQNCRIWDSLGQACSRSGHTSQVDLSVYFHSHQYLNPVKLTWRCFQGSNLGHILFFGQINDLKHYLGNNKALRLLYAPANKIEVAINQFSKLARMVAAWAEHNRLTLNLKKTKTIIFGTEHQMFHQALQRCKYRKLQFTTLEIRQNFWMR